MDTPDARYVPEHIIEYANRLLSGDGNIGRTKRDHIGLVKKNYDPLVRKLPFYCGDHPLSFHVNGFFDDIKIPVVVNNGLSGFIFQTKSHAERTGNLSLDESDGTGSLPETIEKPVETRGNLFRNLKGLEVTALNIVIELFYPLGVLRIHDG